MQIGRESAQFKKLKWIQRPRGTGYPSKRWGHTAVIHEGKLLIYGGNHAGISKEGVYKIDCETLEGSQMHFENMPQIRESHSCNIIKDSLYIFGGCINQELTNDLLQFKLTEPNHYWRKIQQKNSIPPRQSHVSLTLSHRHILIYGGTTPEEVMLDDFWLVDLETCSWQQVSDIKGLLQPKIGCTMTLVNSNIYVFGGQFGEGDDSQLSSDLYRLKFDNDNYSSSPPPGLTISKMQVIGTRPAPRTGHCCIDYKGKMLIIVGGQGVTAKKTPALYNDLWVFDLRNSTWTELLAQNRSNFRARTNFTANIYKNTIYVFGGFINLTNFKSTDDFATITLHEAKHSEANKHNSNVEHDPKALKVPLHCNICKFEYNPQGRVIQSNKVQVAVSSEGSLTSNLSNVIMAARTIGSCFQALGLLLHSISYLPGQVKKEVHLVYSSMEGKEEVNGYAISKQVMQIMNKQYLTISCDDTSLSKKDWQKIIYSYKYLPEQPGFDLKNSLFRLGKQILLSYLFDDDIMHIFLFALNNIYRFSFHRLAISYELAQKKENQILSQFFRHYEIDPKNMHKQSLMIIVGSLNKTDDKTLQLKARDNGCDLQCVVKKQKLILSEFVKEYFLQQVPINLFVGQKKISITPYKKLLKKDRQIEPTTEYFSKIRLVLDEQPSLNSTSSSYVKLYFRNRRVGVYSKYPFISGYIELKEDLQVLNFAKTKCDSWQIRQALEEEIQTALRESRKRQGQTPIRQLREEMYNPK